MTDGEIWRLVRLAYPLPLPGRVADCLAILKRSALPMTDPKRDPTFVSSHNGILRYFAFGHLPPHLQEISRPFAELADKVAHASDTSPETAVALRKLLEAKDAAVRAALPA